MSNPKDEQQQRDGLELEPETIADLDTEEQEADQVRGGGCGILFGKPLSREG